MSEDLLRSQTDYYRARAGEYDQWFHREGRYDRGPEFRARWFAEIEEVRLALAEHGPRGRVVEFAAGTGLWTEPLLRQSDHVTALDISPVALHLNRNRVGTERTTHIATDLFSWHPDRRYDGAFFGFWLSHVLPERFDDFWNLVSRSVHDGGRIFFVDSRYEPTSTASDHRLEGRDSVAVTRRLNDGREYRIVKVFYRPEPLRSRLAALGWTCTIRETESFFLYGWGSPASG